MCEIRGMWMVARGVAPDGVRCVSDSQLWLGFDLLPKYCTLRRKAQQMSITSLGLKNSERSAVFECSISRVW